MYKYLVQVRIIGKRNYTDWAINADHYIHAAEAVARQITDHHEIIGVRFMGELS